MLDCLFTHNNVLRSRHTQYALIKIHFQFSIASSINPSRTVRSPQCMQVILIKYSFLDIDTLHSNGNFCFTPWLTVFFRYMWVLVHFVIALNFHIMLVNFMGVRWSPTKLETDLDLCMRPSNDAWNHQIFYLNDLTTIMMRASTDEMLSKWYYGNLKENWNLRM